MLITLLILAYLLVGFGAARVARASLDPVSRWEGAEDDPSMHLGYCSRHYKSLSARGEACTCNARIGRELNPGWKRDRKIILSTPLLWPLYGVRQALLAEHLLPKRDEVKITSLASPDELQKIIEQEFPRHWELIERGK